MTNCDKEVSLLYPQCCSDKFKTSTMLYCSGLPCLNKTRDMPTMVVTGNGESGFDSGEGA